MKSEFVEMLRFRIVGGAVLHPCNPEIVGAQIVIDSDGFMRGIRCKGCTVATREDAHDVTIEHCELIP